VVRAEEILKTMLLGVEGQRVATERGLAENPHLTPRWFLLMVHSRSEKKVSLALSRKGFEVFLPTVRTKRPWSDRTKEVEFPLFPCYLFCRFRPKDQLSVVSTPNVLFGVGADQHPIPVHDSELAALQRVLASGFDVEPWPYPRGGQVVKISREPLRDVKGVIVQEADTCLLVVGIEAIQSAVAVKIPRQLLYAG
jgi:transcriptional antiterminator RfaH